MATRYVNRHTGHDTGSFTSQAHPARTIAAALKIARPGDTVEIQGAATYPEGELVIDKPLTLISSYAVAHPSVDPTAAGFDPRHLPELRPAPGARRRVLRITGTPSTRGTMGPVRVGGLRIRNGHAVHTTSEPAQGAGGGIVVVDADDVEIERCTITHNRTETAPLSSWPEADRVALRNAIVEVVGEIVSPTAVGAVNVMVRAANFALSRLGHSELASIERAKVLADVGKEIDALLPPGRPNSWLAGQAFGGGFAAVWASPTVRNCVIGNNIAEGRGAGLAVIGYGWPTIEGCHFDANHSGDNGRRDGGGIGCEVSLPGKMSRDLSEVELVRFLVAKVGAVKTAIGSPLSHLSLSDIVDFTVWLANPWRPSPVARGVKRILLELIAGRFKEAAHEALYYLSAAALSRERWQAWKRDEIERAQRTAIAVSRCRFTGNRCADDGGGLYASVMSHVTLSRSRFSDNHAQGCGGGVRLTMGSSGQISACEIFANSARVVDPEGKLIAGGGGLSARNVDLKLSATRIGRSSGGIGSDSNVCSDHAGGGICFQADTEGNLAGIPDLWTTIMREVFEVEAVKVLVGADCTIVGNGAGYDPAHHPLGRTKKAKGGGIWAIQAAFPDAPRLELKIERVASTVSGNVAQTTGYASRVARGLTIATAHQVCLQDLIGSKEWTEVNYGSLLSGPGDLKFAP